MIEIKDETKIGSRPIIITIISIWIFLYAAFEFLLVIIPASRTELAQQFGGTMIPIAGLVSILDIAAGVGYWNMRKWGVYLYIIAVVVGYGGSLLHHIKITIFDLIPVAILSIGFTYLKRMR